MSQYKKGYYRVYVKNRLGLNNSVILSLRVLEFTVKRDALKSATSSFVVEGIPRAINEGDVLILMDPYGLKMYTGVIVRVENRVIECTQIMSLFNDNYKYDITNKVTIEETIANMIETQFKVNDDPMIKALFKPFRIEYSGSEVQKLPIQEPKYVCNLESFFYKLFDDYGILIDFVIPFEKETPKIIIKTNTTLKIKMIDNTIYTPIMMPTTEVYEINKLIVYGEDGEYRGSYYGSRNGVTNNSEELTRYSVVKTNIVFSKDEIESIKTQNLKDDMYNHKLEIEMILDNKLYKFEEMSLGQEFDVWIKNRYYNTILTGYEFSKSANEDVKTVNLIFGKVRTKASQRWNVK